MATAVYRAKIVVPMVGPPISNGAVIVVGDRIAEVGSWREVRPPPGAVSVDLGEHALLPGLINAHCHLDYTGMRGSIPRQRTFTDWVRAINARKSESTSDDYLAAITEGFAEAQKFGTTSVVNLEAFPQLLRNIDAAPLRTWWCAEMIDVREPVSPARIAEELKCDFTSHQTWQGGIGLAPHAPFTASASLYREAAAIGRRDNIVLTTHLAESRDETEMFRDGRGPLFDLMAGIGRPMADCGQRTPVAAMVELGVLDQRWIVTHLNELTEADLRQLAGSPKFHIAHCPRSHAFFGHAEFQFERLRALGFNICLGTDSLASNENLSLFSEMRHFRTRQPSLSAREVLEMVTVNAAKAIGEPIGSIAPGIYADLIAVPLSAGGEIYEAIVNFERAVPWLTVGGEVLTRF